MRLQNKVIIITGSCTGIGKAIARRCVAEGAKVVVHGLDQAPGEALVADSSFSSLGEEIDFLAPYPFVNPLAKLLMTFVLDNDPYAASPLEKIGEISPRPVYIIQGRGDKVASPDSAEELYEAAGDPRFLWVEIVDDGIVGFFGFCL